MRIILFYSRLIVFLFDNPNRLYETSIRQMTLALETTRQQAGLLLWSSSDPSASSQRMIYVTVANESNQNAFFFYKFYFFKERSTYGESLIVSGNQSRYTRWYRVWPVAFGYESKSLSIRSRREKQHDEGVDRWCSLCNHMQETILNPVRCEAKKIVPC